MSSQRNARGTSALWQWNSNATAQGRVRRPSHNLPRQGGSNASVRHSFSSGTRHLQATPELQRNQALQSSVQNAIQNDFRSFQQQDNHVNGFTSAEHARVVTQSYLSGGEHLGLNREGTVTRAGENSENSRQFFDTQYMQRNVFEAAQSGSYGVSSMPTHTLQLQSSERSPAVIERRTNLDVRQRDRSAEEIDEVRPAPERTVPSSNRPPRPDPRRRNMRGRENSASNSNRLTAGQLSDDASHNMLSKSIEALTATVSTSFFTVCTQLTKAREDLQESHAKHNDNTVLLLEAVRDLKFQIMGMRSARSPNDTLEELEASMVKKADTAQEFVKFWTCLEFLDSGKDESVFCSNICKQKPNESALVIRAAMFVNQEEDSDPNAFLRREILVKQRGKPAKVQIGVHAGRGQGRAHENIRKRVISSFSSSCPVDTGLNQGSTHTEDQRKALATVIHDNGHHRTQSKFRNAWASAYHAARVEAFRTAKASEAVLKSQYPEVVLPCLPPMPTFSENIQMTIYSVAFVSVKITKNIHAVATGSKGGLQKSHGPSWADEAVAISGMLTASDPRQHTKGFPGNCMIEGKTLRIVHTAHMGIPMNADDPSHFPTVKGVFAKPHGKANALVVSKETVKRERVGVPTKIRDFKAFSCSRNA